MIKKPSKISIVIDEGEIPRWYQWLIREIDTHKDFSFKIYSIPLDALRIGDFLLDLLFKLDKKLFVDKRKNIKPPAKIKAEVYKPESLRDCALCLWISTSEVPKDLCCPGGILKIDYSLGGNIYKNKLKLVGRAYCDKRLPSVSLVKLGSPNEIEVLTQGKASIHPYSLNRMLEPLMWKSVHMIWSYLFGLTQSSAVIFKDPLSDVGKRHSQARLWSIYITRLVLKGIQSRRTKGQWILLLGNRGEAFDKFRHIVPDVGQFWADPFLFQFDDIDYLFFEELDYKTDKGHLCVAEIMEDGSIAHPTKIIEEAYHLSYPFVFSYEGRIFMIPESSAAKRIDLYECEKFPFEWNRISTLHKNIHALDTTLFYHNGLWWMFTCVRALPGMNENEELHLFYAENPITQDWRPHPQNPVVNDPRYARSAGSIFIDEGIIIRPSQDCSFLYGQSLNFRCIELLTTTVYKESKLDYKSIASKISYSRVHTYTRQGRLEVFDAMREIKQ